MGRAHEVRAASMAKTAAAKSKLYAKYAKEIFMAAKSGDPDPNTNLALAKVIQKAKKENVTADVIKRSIDKAKGNDGTNYTEMRYEGMGPGNVMMIVDCLTDNTNRTFTEVRTAFNKCGGSLGNSGSAMFMFQRLGQLIFEGMTEDEALEALLMGDANPKDVTVEDGIVTVTSEPADYEGCRAAIEAANSEIEFLQAGVTFVPNSYVDIPEDKKEKFERLIDMLNELDDVDDIYHNGNL